MFSFFKNKSFLKKAAFVKKAAFFTKAAFLTFALFLSAGLLFTSCDTGGDSGNSGFIPVGEWASAYNDGYKITNSTLEQWSADSVWDGVTYPGHNTKGNISEAVDFSQGAGVLIIQITSDTTGIASGKFIGVYYKDYTASHVFLANAIDASYATIVKDTLAEAKNTFNVDNVGTHVTMWGSGYNK